MNIVCHISYQSDQVAYPIIRVSGILWQSSNTPIYSYINFLGIGWWYED